VSVAVGGRQADAAAVNDATWLDLVVRRLGREDVRLPMVPTYAARILDLCRDENTPLHALQEVVQGEQVVAAKLLQLSNTLAYARGRPVGSVRDAVVRMGVEHVRTVVLGLAVSSVMQDETVYGEHGPALQVHAVGAATCARAVAGAAGEEPHVAFTAGLFHDIGKLVLLKLAWDVRLSSGVRPTAGALASLLDQRHADAGALLLRKWAIPLDVHEAVGLHEDVACAQAPTRLPAVAYAANRLAHRLGLGCPPSSEDLSADPVFQHLGLSAEWIAARDADLMLMVDDALRVFRHA
jgi:HD-like signal output (HDOD) protein